MLLSAVMTNSVVLSSVIEMEHVNYSNKSEVAHHYGRYVFLKCYLVSCFTTPKKKNLIV